MHLDEAYPEQAGANTVLHWEKVLQDVAARGVERVILGGDLGEAHTLSYLFDSLQTYPDLHLTLGNHDALSDIRPHFKPAQQAATTLHYAFDEGGYRYIFLDSSTGMLSTEQFRWLQQQLKTPASILLFIHHPIFGINALVDELFPLKGRAVLQDLLLRAGRRITIFCGHYHTPHQQTQGSVTQYIAPAVSVQFDAKTQYKQLRFQAERFGYRLLAVEAEAVRSEVVWV